MPRRNYNAELRVSITNFLREAGVDGVNQLLRITLESILGAEQDEFLGYGYREKTKGSHNKRNGYRLSRRFKGYNNKVFRISVPRDRQGLFKPFILDILREENERVNDIALSLYAKGLSTREISEVIEQIYGKCLSSASISNISNRVKEEIRDWLCRELEERYYVLYIDAIRLAVRRDSVSKEAFYIVLGLRTDLKREILGVYNFPEESLEGWRDVLKDIEYRGVKEVGLIVSDEFNGIEVAIAERYPRANWQVCLVHKERNILKYVRSKDKEEVARDFKEVIGLSRPNARKDKMHKAVKRLRSFIDKWGKIYPSIRRIFKEGDYKRYFVFIKYPYEMRRYIYTNNWIENINSLIKRTTKVRKSFPTIESAINLIYLRCIDIEERFLRYPVPHLQQVKPILDRIMFFKYRLAQTHKT